MKEETGRKREARGMYKEKVGNREKMRQAIKGSLKRETKTKRKYLTIVVRTVVAKKMP